MNAPMSRRQFIATGAALVGAATLRAKGSLPQNPAWAGEVGITTSTVFRQMAAGRADRTFGLLDLPKFVRDELGMKVIDLNSGTLVTHDSAQLDKFRSALDAAGCVISNLKVNNQVLSVKVQDLQFEHADPEIRAKSMEGYRDWIRAGSRVGARWVRPFPADTAPDFKTAVASLTELADFAESQKMSVILENAGWMGADPENIPKLIEATGGRLGTQPDTGSWDPSLRERGLARTFPYAVSCDFKFGKLGPHGEHKAYDLKRCFELGWQAGFRGPWVLEHTNENTKELVHDLTWVRDQLKTWMREAKT